jgi:hypothetical protein
MGRGVCGYIFFGKKEQGSGKKAVLVTFTRLTRKNTLKASIHLIDFLSAPARFPASLRKIPLDR